MFNTTKNSKNLSMLSIAFMLCMASLFIDCGKGGGETSTSTSASTSAPAPTTCQNGSGAVGACVSCDAGFRLEVGLCNPIPGAPCADGSGSAGACVSCNTGFVLAGGSCFAQVNVSFDLNGGTGGVAPAPLPLRAGESVTVPGIGDATLDGFTFIGWSTLRTNAGTDFVRAGNTYIIPAVRVPSGTLTLYATWGEAYTVTYSLNGGVGSAPSPSVGVAGAEVTLRSLTLSGLNNNRPANASASPTDGFFGWGVNADGTGITWYTANQSVLFASNTTLYALWYYSINYDCGEGTATTPANFPIRTTARTGEVLTNLPLTGCSRILTSTPRAIIGWSTAGNAPYITTMPNGPITLRAVYGNIVDLDGDGLIEISTAEQLNNMRYNLAGTNWKTSADDAGSAVGCPPSRCRGYELTTNIDFATTKWGTSSAYAGDDRVTAGWEPIGNCGSNEACNDATDTPFMATFEGRGFEIRNLYINRPSNTNETGLFGALSVGTLNQVALVSVAVRGKSYTGGLVGFQNGATTNNSYVRGIVIANNSNTGGLVGFQNGGTVGSSYFIGTIMGSANFTGGLVGHQNTGVINNSYATGAVTSSGIDTGGLVGNQQYGGTVNNSYTAVTVTGSSNFTGGLVGNQNTGVINNSYATGAVTGSVDTGGLVGNQNTGVINNSYATGAVTGSGIDTGGLAGFQNSGTINNSYATGAVTGSGNFTGGLVGNQNTGTINNSYATGAVTGPTYVGGLVGQQNLGSTVSNSYATGIVSATDATSIKGGLVGFQNGNNTVNGSYWNTTTTGQMFSYGGTGAQGLSTENMQLATVGATIRGLGTCFNFLGNNRYPQLYTWDTSLATPACTTTPLFGPNGN